MIINVTVITVVSVYSYGLTRFSLFKSPILSLYFSIFLPSFHSLSFSLRLTFYLSLYHPLSFSLPPSLSLSLFLRPSFPPSLPPWLPPSLSMFLISQAAEEWLKREDPFAFQLRDEIMRQYGLPASPIRPEVTSPFFLPILFSIYVFVLLKFYLKSNVHK